VPLVDWPAAFVGLSYFVALLAAWSIGRGRVPAVVEHVADVGALVSVIYLGVLLAERVFCAYCVAVHAGNLSFRVFFRTRGSSRTAPSPVPRSGTAAPALAGVVTFVGLTIALAVARDRITARVEHDEELALARSIESILARSSRDVHLVVFMDYQCQACRRVDRDVAETVHAHPDLALSIKHFPMCGD
jgi:hypothetical protein